MFLSSEMLPELVPKIQQITRKNTGVMSSKEGNSPVPAPPRVGSGGGGGGVQAPAQGHEFRPL